MDEKRTIFRGCLLGMAVGDAMGYTVDSRTLEEIQQDYGPNGLLGYDLVNGYADITSYTQIAAFVTNGLLLGMTRGQMRGVMAPFIRYVSLSLREWLRNQHFRSDPGQVFCWVGRAKELRTRRCMDTSMLDALSRDKLGCPEEPVNKFSTAGTVTTAIPIGLFSNTQRISGEEADRLAAETAALTHGNPAAFLTNAAAARLIALTAQNNGDSLEDLVQNTIDAVQLQFGRDYPQCIEIWELLRMALTLARAHQISQTEAMEQLRCETAAEVLAGAVYACLVSRGDFDSAMIAAVNHSGRSAAVGSLTGAILGARLGEDALPGFYLECLEPTDVLRELADDLAQGCPMDMGSSLFDDDWDRKYIHGGAL